MKRGLRSQPLEHFANRSRFRILDGNLAVAIKRLPQLLQKILFVLRPISQVVPHVQLLLCQSVQINPVLDDPSLSRSHYCSGLWVAERKTLVLPTIILVALGKSKTSDFFFLAFPSSLWQNSPPTSRPFDTWESSIEPSCTHRIACNGTHRACNSHNASSRVS